MKPSKLFKQILILLRDFLMLCVIGNTLSLFTLPGEMWSLKIVLSNCLFSISIGYPAWKGMTYLILILERRLPWLKFPIKRLVVQVLSLSVFMGLIIFIGFTVWVALDERFTFQSIWAEALPSLKVAFIFVFLSLLVGSAILFFKNWREAAIQQEELKRAHLALQYQSLKDQVRPNFLFNSLSSLATLINTDSKP